MSDKEQAIKTIDHFLNLQCQIKYLQQQIDNLLAQNILLHERLEKIEKERKREN